MLNQSQNLTLAVQKRIFPLSRQWKRCPIKYQKQFKALGSEFFIVFPKRLLNTKFNAWLMTKFKVKFHVFNFDSLTVQFVKLILNLWQKWYVISIYPVNKPTYSGLLLLLCTPVVVQMLGIHGKILVWALSVGMTWYSYHFLLPLPSSNIQQQSSPHLLYPCIFPLLLSLLC